MTRRKSHEPLPGRPRSYLMDFGRVPLLFEGPLVSPWISELLQIDECVIETFIYRKKYIDCQAPRMYRRTSLLVLATFACRHAPSGQRHGWGGGASPYGVFDTRTDAHPPPQERRV